MLLTHRTHSTVYVIQVSNNYRISLSTNQFDSILYTMYNLFNLNLKHTTDVFIAS